MEKGELDSPEVDETEQVEERAAEEDEHDKQSLVSSWSAPLWSLCACACGEGDADKGASEVMLAFRGSR